MFETMLIGDLDASADDNAKHPDRGSGKGRTKRENAEVVCVCHDKKNISCPYIFMYLYICMCMRTPCASNFYQCCFNQYCLICDPSMSLLPTSSSQCYAVFQWQFFLPAAASGFLLGTFRYPL